jgi:integrase
LARRLPYFYTKDQLKVFMDIITNPVHRAIFIILFGSGLRISELLGQEKVRCITCSHFYRQTVGSPERRTPGIPSCRLTSQPLQNPPTKHRCERYELLHSGLNVQQVDMQAGTLRLIGKGNVERIVGLSPKAQATLAEILDGKVPGISVDQHTGRIDFGVGIRRVEQLAKFYAKKANLPDLDKFGRWSPHKMRHTHLTRLVDAARELGQADAALLAKEQAGHRSLVTTEIYLHSATTSTTRKMLEKTDI